jgi:hypothetical protein
MTIQQPLSLLLPPAAGAKGSSSLLTGPQMEGTKGSFVELQYSIKLDRNK